MDRRIKFRHLDAFSAIARTGRLKHAAEHLHLTQPAITRTLKELEEITGVRLMERDRAGVNLTAEGEVFLQFAEQSTAALRNGLRSVRAGSAASGQLRLGILPSVATGLLPAAALHFASANPEVTLELFEGPHADLTGRLRSGNLDLVIGRLGQPETMDGLSFRQLYSEEAVIVCRHDSAAKEIRTFEDLERMRVLYPPKNSAIRPLVARLLIAHSVPLFTNRIESASSSFGRALVMSDPNTVWFISRGVVANDLRLGDLACLDLDTSATVGAVGVMSRSDEYLSLAARAFAKTVARLHHSGSEAQKSLPPYLALHELAASEALAGALRLKLIYQGVLVGFLAAWLFASAVEKTGSISVAAPNATMPAMATIMDRPTSIIEVASLLSNKLGYEIRSTSPPKLVSTILLGPVRLANHSMRENAKAMNYVSSGQYVADVTRQTDIFGPPSTVEASVKRWVAANRATLKGAAS